jgi:hypothetical protein
MVDIKTEIYDIVNRPGRVGVLGTADKNGQPNVAYFGSLRLGEGGIITLGMSNNRSLKNLRENPLAVLFVVTESPVDFNTVGIRLYLTVKEIQDQGPLFEAVKSGILKYAGKNAAAMIVAAAAFEVTEIRGLMDWRGR